MSVLNQFMESSIAVTEQIALMMQENERLKKRVAELEDRELEQDLRRMKPVVEAVKQWMSDDKGKNLEALVDAYCEYKSNL